MKHILHMLAVATLAFGLIACDHVVLPGGGGSGGGQGDSTGTGGGGRDDSTGTGGGNDTTRGPFAGITEVSGPIVDMTGNVATAPEGSSVVILWNTGQQGVQMVYGSGALNRERTAYTIRLNRELPDEALFDPDDSGGIHGIGTIVLTDLVFADGDLVRSNPNGAFFDHLGVVTPYDLIYYTGREKMTPWTSPWIINFPTGYSMALTGFTGWVPVDEDEYPLTLMTR